jgi:hypothetical protein
MLDMSVQVDPASMREFQNAISDIEKFTRRDIGQSVEYAAVMVAKSLRARTPMGRKKRDVFPNPHRTGKGKSAKGAKYVIQYLNQGGAPTFLPVNSKTSPRRVIKQRGLAKSSWGWILLNLGSPQGRDTAVAGGLARKYIEVTKRTADLNPSVRIQNKLSYLDKIIPGIVGEALRAATSAMNKRLSLYKDGVLKAWNKA